MDLQLKNKVAILAASTDGLGLATAKQLLQEGASVAVCGRDQKRNASAYQTLISDADDAHVFVGTCDVTDQTQVNHFVAKTAEKFGQIDIVITNAGGPPAGTFETVDMDAYEKGFRLTLMSAVYFIKATLSFLKKSTDPAILTITSRSAKAPIPNLFISNVIRPAVIGLTKTLSQEFGTYGIRVNSILPGWTETERTIYLIEKRAEKLRLSYDECKSEIIKTFPLGRMGKPEEFANAATFLVSPAASYINGVMLLVDGGDYPGLG